MITESTSANHLVTLLDWSPNRITRLLELAHDMKKAAKCGPLGRDLERKTLALIFEKSSMRTRISFEVAMTQLGGASIYLSKSDINLGEREPVKDGARVLARYVDAVAARVYRHKTVEELAAHSRVPVINALSDRFHPCQALADMMTIQERPGGAAKTVAYVGDANNVARSLAVVCAKLGYFFKIASPPEYRFDEKFIETLSPVAKETGGGIECFVSPHDAAENADVLYTDTWISMGQEGEEQKRRSIFSNYKIDSDLQSEASADHIVMHCLPACRGEEITDEALEGPNSAVFDQAENRLHAQRALLYTLMAG